MASAARVRETPPTEIAIFGRMPASAQYSVQLSGQAALEIALPPSRYYKGVCRKLPGPRCAGNSDMHPAEDRDLGRRYFPDTCSGCHDHFL